MEEYPITQAFLNLLTTLAPSLLNSTINLTEPLSLGADPCEALSRLVHFTTETIFLKHTMRAYRRQNERVRAPHKDFFRRLICVIFLFSVGNRGVLCGPLRGSRERLPASYALSSHSSRRRRPLQRQPTGPLRLDRSPRQWRRWQRRRPQLCGNWPSEHFQT